MNKTAAASKTKSEKISGSEQVAAFLTQLEHPFKSEILEVRDLILQARPELTEQIKWNAPSFCFKGEDRITFNLQGKQFFRLIFHFGAKKKVRSAPILQDETGLLTWLDFDRATVTFTDMADVKQKEKDLIAVINKWLAANC